MDISQNINLLEELYSYYLKDKSIIHPSWNNLFKKNTSTTTMSLKTIISQKHKITEPNLNPLDADQDEQGIFLGYP